MALPYFIFRTIKRDKLTKTFLRISKIKIATEFKIFSSDSFFECSFSWRSFNYLWWNMNFKFIFLHILSGSILSSTNVLARVRPVHIIDDQASSALLENHLILVYRTSVLRPCYEGLWHTLSWTAENYRFAFSGFTGRILVRLICPEDEFVRSRSWSGEPCLR